jgi:hypothetical protein
MTSAIRNTIVAAIATKVYGNAEDIEQQYAEHISNVEKALVEREQYLTESLINLVDSRHGYDYAEEAKELLAEIGFEIKPEPQPEPVIEDEPAADLTDSERIGKVGERVTLLEEGQAKILDALGTLTRLAEKHLGTSSL